MNEPLSIINQVNPSSSPLEKAGDFFLTPARLFFGRTYTKSIPDQDLNVHHLKSEEDLSISTRILKVALAILFPISLISTGIGYALKWLSHKVKPELEGKYRLQDRIINARTDENFNGKLPPLALSPNCVSTQKHNVWGAQYNADPIQIPDHLSDVKDVRFAINRAIHRVVDDTDRTAKVVEFRHNYAHFEFTVPALGKTFIDDVDIYIDMAEKKIDIRSASREGFRDALHLSWSKPGANKKRIEAIREAFQQEVSQEA